MSVTTRMMPIYDIHKSYLENAEAGPLPLEQFPECQRPHKDQWIDFLGHSLALPLGVPAGPLLNSTWITFASRLGFDLLTYKTIRSHEHLGHSLPNVLFVDSDRRFNPDQLPKVVKVREKNPEQMDQIAITNSFGNPSRTFDFLRKDIPKAIESLLPGQAMVVSVFGTDFEDYVKTARFAVECGATLIEANLSCPNVKATEGVLYQDPESVYQLASKLTRALGAVPLILKVGYYEDKKLMEKVFCAAAKARVSAMAGINTLPCQVVDQEGRAALGEKRPTSGICGAPIYLAARRFTKWAREIIDTQKLEMQLITTGGAMDEHELKQFLDDGATIAKTATGMMWDPYIASRYMRSYK